jgi:hypothetical protein
MLHQRLGSHLRTNRRLQYAIVAASGLFILLAIWLWTSRESLLYSNYDRVDYLPDSASPPHAAATAAPVAKPGGGISHSSYRKPKDIKIYGLVFYGRWDRVQILDCYLKVSVNPPRAVGRGTPPH